jgi:hypothetical protein
MPNRGDQLPHFRVTRTTGEPFEFERIWQRRHLLLVALGDGGTDERYCRELIARAPDWQRLDAELVITTDRVAGLEPPAVLVADRWGEIVHVTAATGTAGLPGAHELTEWLDFVARRCPECEGEAR